MIKVAFVLNMPTPYRNPVFRLMVRRNKFTYRFMYCSHAEPDRSWKVSNDGLDVLFLKHNLLRRFSSHVHANLNVWHELVRFRPDVVVTGGYNPTHLLAVLYCFFVGARHISSTDGDLQYERRLSPVHRLVRRLVRRSTSAYVGPSDSSLELFQSWGASKTQVFKSPLCADNVALAASSNLIKEYDFIFCGRFVEHKGTLFSLEVASSVAKILGRPVKIAFLGDGPLLRLIEDRAESLEDVEVTVAGFIQPEDTPKWFGQSRILLLPSNFDPWGLVVNEACAAGLAVMTSPFVGASRELVDDGVTGFILPLEVPMWSAKASAILADDRALAEMGRLGKAKTDNYSYSKAAAGYEGAISYVIGVSH